MESIPSRHDRIPGSEIAPGIFRSPTPSTSTWCAIRTRRAHRPSRRTSARPALTTPAGDGRRPDHRRAETHHPGIREDCHWPWPPHRVHVRRLTRPVWRLEEMWQSRPPTTLPCAGQVALLDSVPVHTSCRVPPPDVRRNSGRGRADARAHHRVGDTSSRRRASSPSPVTSSTRPARCCRWPRHVTYSTTRVPR